MVKLLGLASGSRGMAGGQAIDLAAVGKTLTVPELEFMHIHKTGALIRAAAVLGARCGAGLSEAEFARVDAYAKAVGLAFQVVDDVLDAEAPTAARLLVVERADGAGGRWVFGVDEVAGVQQVVRSTMRSVPSTVSQSNARMCQALFDWQDRTVGLIDDARLLDGLAELIAH
jgi:hypothetical protein